MARFWKDEYEVAMEQAYAEAQNGGTVELDNFDRVHARKAIRFMLSKAQERVVLLCHRLATDVYGSREMIDALKNALRRNAKINVYVRDNLADLSLFNDVLAMNGVEICTGMDVYPEVAAIGDFLLVDPEATKTPCMLRQERDPAQRSGRLFFGDKQECINVLTKIAKFKSCIS